LCNCSSAGCKKYTLYLVSTLPILPPPHLNHPNEL
jgi:hypothetical protein